MDKQHLIKLISEITSINSVNPAQGGKGEFLRGKFIENYIKTKYSTQLTKQKISIKNYQAKDNKNNIRPNLILTIPGNSKKTLWFIAHLDTVSAGNLKDWLYEPFKATFVDKEQRVYGRGVNDNGSGIFANFILIDKVINNLNAENNIPKYTLKFAFLSDEEDGSNYGLKYLINSKEAGNEFKQGDFALVPDAGNKKGDTIEIAEKGILWLKQECYGKQCHGSLPCKGVNAHLNNTRFALHLYDSLPKKFKASDKLFVHESKSTFEITKKENNVEGINIIPGHDVLYWDMRILPKYKTDEVLIFILKEAKKFEKKYKCKFAFTPIQKEEASSTPINSPIIIELKKAIKKVLKVNAKTSGIGGGTFAGILRKKNIDSAVWAVLSETEHIANEYELVENYYKIAEVFEKLVY